MTTPWSAFFPNIVPDVPGAPLAVVEHAVREAVREFCERTLFWQETLVLDLDAGVHTYPVIPEAVGSPPNEVIPYLVQRINRAKIANQEDALDEASEDMLDQLDPTWRTKTGDPYAYYQPAPNMVRIVYPPSGDLVQGLELELAVKPLPNAPELLNDDILPHHLDDIASGAKARLMLSPKKPYSDAQMGAMHRAKFNAVIGAVATRRARDFTKLPMRVRGYDR